MVLFLALSLISLSSLLCGVGLFQSHISFPNEILYCAFVGCNIWKNTLTLKCHKCLGKEPSLSIEQVGPEWKELPSFWTFQANWLSWQWYDTHWALWHSSLSVRGEGAVWPHVERPHPQKWRIGQLTPWALLWRYADADVKDDPLNGW